MIHNIKELKAFILDFDGRLGEHNLNLALLKMIENDELTQEVFLEYLSITQGEIFRIFEDFEE